jgi:hypothetical protein
MLVTCHLGKPQLPTIHADEQYITAVVRGYCQQRKPSATELRLLEHALRYDIARRVGLENLFSTLSEDWRQEIRWQKMLARSHVIPEIATMARHAFEQEIEAVTRL